MKLYIGNKNYSSWSLRPWFAMKQLGIAFDEVALRFENFREDTGFRREIARVSPAGRVPVLVDDDGFSVWDSLAIVEYLHERFPDKGVWPSDRLQRARARSLCAEMHAGFGVLRTAFPMNIEADLRSVGPRVLAEQPAVRKDADRLIDMWTTALAESGGPFLFGAFGAIDAFFAPVVWRLSNYGVPVPAVIGEYSARVKALPAMQAWVDAALAEHDWVADDEPYRTQT